ncbi:hypothetical protein P154DRAFT_484831 [Amniculicola lignicola CBS 123094]|uniref:Extracellular membrane protein CFEM domain-containing protein n=1 Tax=Amniculicola lignicola CBS 123094 TaxID=1392246 RepID=A0A6A5X090_9PLEO|nr:hypothetical protein P154DRAFT_484831 [Amniculicola lignicola CBS 123094]
MMKVFTICVLLLTAARGSAITTGIAHASTGVDSDDADIILTPQVNRGGWVNPEDLTSMPQCIAQQDTSAWLSAMSKCTSKRCTNHFGVICTHHQWLTQLSCLSAAFSPDVLKGYLPYCGRSVLAKAQLYQWVRRITGRTWLVEVGDANELHNLRPASLFEGYATLDVVDRAPSCLATSVSAASMEHFSQLLASCQFTGTTEHTGNAKRPWEYSESHRSMIALDFETAGYDLTGQDARGGNYRDYFDKACFCKLFSVDWTSEPCLGRWQLDVTKERMWMHATCGLKSLPQNWADNLQTTGKAFIPTEDWHWPTCVVDMPDSVIDLSDQCATDACGHDSNGYCEVTSVVDRSCFCRKINYESCGGLCHVFEARIEYVNWLQDLCGDLPDWNGLPDDWRHLAGPRPLDMIPWGWIPSSLNSSSEKCAPNAGKLGSIALVNVASIIAAFFGQELGNSWIFRHSLGHLPLKTWFSTGLIIVALQLLAYWLTALVVQETPGYESIPVIQFILLWCTMPRLTWIRSFFINVEDFKANRASAAASQLFAEMILQFVSSYYMIWTIAYGRAHGFYFGTLAGAEKEWSAQKMYYGALLWIVIMIMAPIPLIRIVRINRSSGRGIPELPKLLKSGKTTSSLPEELMTQFNELCHWLGEKFVLPWMDTSSSMETTPLRGCNDGLPKHYGTLHTTNEPNRASHQAFIKLYAVTGTFMFLLWIAQCIFWLGFIDLSDQLFCPSNLDVITAIWIAASLAITGMGSHRFT